MSKIIPVSILKEITVSCISEAVNFLYSYKIRNSSANLIQAYRDYFEPNTFQRMDELIVKCDQTNYK
jgi:6-phosphogluconate dehydrogenase